MHQLTMVITAVAPSDRESLLQLAVDTGLFTRADADALLGGVLDGLEAAALPAGHQAACCRGQPQGPPLGWCYFAPDAHASGVWNLWWIGVSPAHHGSGAGPRLLAHVEEAVARAGGRLIVIETSDAAPLDRARRFYVARGYSECGRIPDFYGDGDAKIVFTRRLQAADRPGADEVRD